MKIDRILQSVSTVSVNDEKRRTDISQENSVHLSSNVARLQSIDTSSANGPTVDIARIEEIKQAISEDNFKINSEVLVDRLLETVKELIQPKKAVAYWHHCRASHTL